MKNQLKQSPIQIIKQRHYFYYLYHWMKSIYMDYNLSGMTLHKTIFNSIEGMYPTQSIQYVYIKEMIAEIQFNTDDIFVDVGCAWGRLIGYLKRYTTIKKYYGIEINIEIAKKAEMIFKNDSNVTIIYGNIIDHIPDDGTVYYLFNPFDKFIFEQFIEKLEKKLNHDIKLLYLYPTCREVLDNREGWTLEKEILLKPKYFGSLVLCIFHYGQK